MSDQLQSQLSDQLREVAPDLDRLAAGAIASGRRHRRVRRAGAAVGVGAVAGIALLGGVLAMGDRSPSAVQEPGWATSGTPTGLQVGQQLELGHRLVGSVTDSTVGLYELGASTIAGEGTGFVVVVSGPTAQLSDWWSNGFDTLTTDYPGITVAVSLDDAAALGMLGTTDEAPVAVTSDKWECEWSLPDDKAACRSTDGGVAGLVIRDGEEHDAWVTSPDKGNDPSVFTTEVHQGIFITVQAGRGTTNAEIRELGQSLVWVD